jgi:phosphatidylserine/phosphatidylglycerophosphate/cardiolipin synthase-like enzyme/uncharacterized membrane protein YdjX (TVP38/TMEM64 family)
MSAIKLAPILDPGRNCWRVEHADRVAFLVDGAAYFAALAAAMERAQESILIVGWDVNSRMLLCPDAPEVEDAANAAEEAAADLGSMLDRLAAERPALRIHILVWDYAPIYFFERQLLPRFWLDWRRHARVRARLAADHPPGASHHQKIVVVDDAVAFVGGLDLTINRWDTREHRPHDEHRRLPRGDTYLPFHDAQIMVDGAAARALGELARTRWERATGEILPASRRAASDGPALPAFARLAGLPEVPASPELPALDDVEDVWPPGVAVDVEDVGVAIARTFPAPLPPLDASGPPEAAGPPDAGAGPPDAGAGPPGAGPPDAGAGPPGDVREVESLYLDAIAAARHTIYIENQYLTSRTICRALCERLSGDDPPEILILSPHQQSGRLEQLTMGALRARRLDELRAADRHGRLRVMCPVSGGVEINVHAKVMVVDDRLVRVGSSNLSERSMCLDTECDLAIEARSERVAAAIRRFRNGLLAEHLGVTERAVEDALAEHGGLLAATAALLGNARTLVDFELADSEKVEELLLEDSLLDPAEPLDMAVLAQAMPREASQQGIRRLPYVLAFVLVVLGLAALWAWSPLRHWIRPERLAALAAPLGDHTWGPVLAAAGVAMAATLLVPVTVLIVTTSLLFGPLIGPVVAMSGCLAGAAVGYGLGRVLWPDAIQRLAGKRLSRMSRKLSRRGVLTMVAIRVVPIAPFTVINLVAGSAGFRFRDFLIGTLIGLVPGMLGLTLATNRVAAAVRDPDPLSIATALAAVACIAAAIWGLRRWLLRRAQGLRRRRRESVRRRLTRAATAARSA